MHPLARCAPTSALWPHISGWITFSFQMTIFVHGLSASHVTRKENVIVYGGGALPRLGSGRYAELYEQWLARSG